MANPDGQDQFKRTGDTRARGTAPLTGYSMPPLAPMGDERPVEVNELAAEILQAESVVNQLKPRVKALERALQVVENPDTPPGELFKGVSPQERNFTMTLAKALEGSAEAKRRAQIALQQFKGAAEGLRAAQDLKARMLVQQSSVVRDRNFNLAKFKGSTHPLYNFGMVFAGHPVLDTLFPPMRPPATRPLTPPNTSRGTQPLVMPANMPPERPSSPVAGLFQDSSAPAGAPASLAQKGLSLLKMVTDRFTKREGDPEI